MYVVNDVTLKMAQVQKDQNRISNKEPLLWVPIFIFTHFGGRNFTLLVNQQKIV